MSEPVAPRDPAVPMPAATRSLVRIAGAACLLPLLLQLPGWLGPGFGVGALVVLAASWRAPMPAWLRVLLGVSGLLAIAAVSPGFGRDTGCAILAAMLALKPAETFSLRDGRSLVGFGLFGPFATFLLDQGPVSLLLAVGAVLLALLALQRLAADEGGVGARLPWRGATTSMLRLVALGLPLALVAFWLFPRLPSPLWGLPQRAMATPGLSDSMSPGGMFDLLLDDSPAARVEFLGATPEKWQMYWRGPVLWDFDGRTWRQARDLLRLPPAPLTAASDAWDYRIDIEPTEDRQLVALDLPLALSEGAGIGQDYTPWADQAQYNTSRWRMRSAPAARVEPDLPPDLRRRALALPRGFNPRTLALGGQWRAQAGRSSAASDAAIADRALAMIRRDFAYTLNVPPAGRNEVDDFLFDRREGYCEHFSSAFVVLMRAAGIPARVVTGYAGAYRNPIGGYWLVRKSDAHAWAEVWLPARGWVRYDPTAAVAPERIYDTIGDRQPGRVGAFTGLVPLFNASDWMRRGWNDFVIGFNAQRQRDLFKPLGLGAVDPARLALLFALAAVLVLALMAWLVARGERQRDPLLRAWHALEKRYRKLGRGRPPHEPALAWAARAGADRPRAGHTLAELARRVSDARYAAPSEAAAIRQLLRDLRRHRP